MTYLLYHVITNRNFFFQMGMSRLIQVHFDAHTSTISEVLRTNCGWFLIDDHSKIIMLSLYAALKLTDY